MPFGCCGYCTLQRQAIYCELNFNHHVHVGFSMKFFSLFFAICVFMSGCGSEQNLSISSENLSAESFNMLDGVSLIIVSPFDGTIVKPAEALTIKVETGSEFKASDGMLSSMMNDSMGVM